MKLLKAFLISLLATSAFAAGGTTVLQGDSSITVGSVTVTGAGIVIGGVLQSSAYTGGGGGGGGAIIGTGAVGNVPSVSVVSSNTMTMTGSLNAFASSVTIPAPLGLHVTYGVTGSTFTGNGAALTNLTAANISAGSLGASVIASSVATASVGVAQMNFTGTPNSSTFARGDGAWISSSTFGGTGASLSSSNTWTAQQTFNNTVIISTTISLGSFGTNGLLGQVLTSQGQGTTPLWTTNVIYSTGVSAGVVVSPSASGTNTAVNTDTVTLDTGALPPLASGACMYVEFISTFSNALNGGMTQGVWYGATISGASLITPSLYTSTESIAKTHASICNKPGSQTSQFNAFDIYATAQHNEPMTFSSSQTSVTTSASNLHIFITGATNNGGGVSSTNTILGLRVYQ